jgi:hypothetical protein
LPFFLPLPVFLELVWTGCSEAGDGELERVFGLGMVGKQQENQQAQAQ